MEITYTFNHTIDLKKSIHCLHMMKKLLPYKTNSDYSILYIPINIDKKPILLKVRQIDKWNLKIIAHPLCTEEIYLNKIAIIQELHNIFNRGMPIKNQQFNDEYNDIIDGLFIISDTDDYMTLIRTILSQQVSLLVAEKNFYHFLNHYSNKFILDNESYFLPNWEEIFKKIYVENEVNIPTTYSRKNAIIELSKYYINNQNKQISIEVLIKELLDIKGIGPWTIQMLLLFRYPSITHNNIPIADLGLHRAIELIHDLPHKSISKNNILEYINGFNSLDIISYWYILMYTQKYTI